MGASSRYGKYIKFITYLVTIVLINIVGITLYARIDLTANKTYSISAVSKKVVATLTEPLTIKVFFTRDLPAPHNTTEQYLRDLLEEYALYADRHFNYSFYDVNPEGAGLLPARRGRPQGAVAGQQPDVLVDIDQGLEGLVGSLFQLFGFQEAVSGSYDGQVDDVQQW